MQLLLEQSAADSSAATPQNPPPQNPKAGHASGSSQHLQASPMEQSRGAENSKPPGKKQRKKSGSVERAASEAAKQAEIWAAASDAAATAAAVAAAAAATAGTSPATTSVWPGRRPTDAEPQRGLASVPQAEWRNQAETYRASASAGGPVADSAEAFRHSPKPRDSSGMFPAPPGSVMDAAASTPGQDALRQQALHHGRHAVPEASSPSVPPTVNQHPLHPGVAGPVGAPGTSPPQHPAAQHRQHHSSYPRPAIAMAGLPHQNQQANVTYIHMPSAASARGGSAEPASSRDAVVPKYLSSQTVRSATGELPGAGDVRGGSAGSSGVGGGLATTPRVTVPGFGITAARAGLHALSSESKVRLFRRTRSYGMCLPQLL